MIKEMIDDMLKQAQSEFDQAKSDNADVKTRALLLGRVDALQSVRLRLFFLETIEQEKNKA